MATVLKLIQYEQLLLYGIENMNKSKYRTAFRSANSLGEQSSGYLAAATQSARDKQLCGSKEPINSGSKIESSVEGKDN